jgi:hypothetical protein
VKLVSKSATIDHLAITAFPGLIAQYRLLLEPHHTIYKLAHEDKSQFERMSYDQYALIEQSSQNFARQVDRALIAFP